MVSLGRRVRQLLMPPAGRYASASMLRRCGARGDGHLCASSVSAASRACAVPRHDCCMAAARPWQTPRQLSLTAAEGMGAGPPRVMPGMQVRAAAQPLGGDVAAGSDQVSSVLLADTAWAMDAAMWCVCTRGGPLPRHAAADRPRCASRHLCPALENHCIHAWHAPGISGLQIQAAIGALVLPAPGGAAPHPPSCASRTGLQHSRGSRSTGT